MASIQERTDAVGKNHYRVQIRRRGFPSLTATFDRKTDAKNWAIKTEAELKSRRHFKEAVANKVTVAETIDRYVLNELPKKKLGTQIPQKRHLAWWRASLGYVLLIDLSPGMIAEARDQLGSEITRRGTKRSPSTVVRYLAALGHCLTVATKEWRWLDENPMRNVSKPREPHGRVRFLSDEERKRLLRACDESKNPYLYTIVVLAIVTGMRRSEIMFMRWDQIDFQRGVVTLFAEETKTGETRAVPLSRHAAGLLRELEQVRRTDTNLVFPAPTTIGKATRPIDIQSAWSVAMRRADIDDFRFHDLRHTAASYLAMTGATLAEIAEVLGHKTLSMVKRYSHMTEAHTSKVVEKMSTAVFG